MVRKIKRPEAHGIGDGTNGSLPTCQSKDSGQTRGFTRKRYQPRIACNCKIETNF